MYTGEIGKHYLPNPLYLVACHATMYIHIYAHIYMIHACIYIYICTNAICMYIHTYTHAICKNALSYTYIYKHTHTLSGGPGLRLWPGTFTHPLSLGCVCVYICVYVCICVYLSLPYKEGRGLFFSVSRVATVENKNRTLVFFIDNLVSWIH